MYPTFRRRIFAGTATLACALGAMAAPLHAADPAPAAAAATPGGVPDTAKPGPDRLFTPTASTTSGTVAVEGHAIAYTAEAGTLVIHAEGHDDAAWRERAAKGEAVKDDAAAEASMFYVAYFAKGAPSANRPITFLFNGGPGSSTVWLHMGAFGPRRVVTADDSHTPAAPYRVVDNAFSLLDATDLVFVDAPGTGFSRIAGKDKEKAFWGMDADAHAFEEFVKQFLSAHARWNSPKYLFGESYGTPRAAVLANALQGNDEIDLNGVILLSQILNFDMSIDTPQLNPGTDEPYIVGLPTYAATAWYHNKLPGGRPADLEAFLKEVQHFATTDYAGALMAGSELDPAKKAQIADQLSKYTGIPADYYLRANLRVEGGQFTQQLQLSDNLTTGRLDTRFSGPAMDVFNKEADYDPQSAAIGSAYVAAFNDYVRDGLHYTPGIQYKPEIDVFQYWDFNHKEPGQAMAVRGATNVMNDLAVAMKYNPGLHVMVNGGYFDLATPYFEGWYEMHHLPIPASLQNNIEYHYFQSGHMVYAHEASLKDIHDAVAGFIARTSHPQ